MSSILNSFALYLAVALGLILAGVALLSLRNPIIGKLGVRNIPRRPTQSTLIVLGLTLSTTIIVSALSLGDTLENSIRRQTIDAYGQIDQVVSPTFLLDLTGLIDSESIDVDQASSPESALLLNALIAGDLTALIALLDEGLPGISEQRYEQLREETESYPLIDGVAGSVLFPTIIRNVSTGQGEPLGFIFAVDENYDTGFGLHDVDGTTVHTADLRPGVGDVFVDLVGLWVQTGEAANEIGAAFGVENVGVAEAALAVGAVGTQLLADEGPTFTLRQLALPVDALRDLGIDMSIFDEEGIETISLEGLGISDDDLEQFNLDADAPISIPTLPMLGFDLPDEEELLIAITEALSAINLNTLGQDVDESLGQFGLQLRQGEVYLNQLGAQQLDARAGDLLEVFIGPIPLPYRVRAVVEESGPLGALLPVVMMHTDEAQKLLFMPDRVNNILISNTGDEVSGMVHTSEVSDHLRSLSLNEARLAALLEILRRPEVAEIIRKEAVAPDNPLTEDNDVPQFFMELAGMWSQVASFESDIAVLAAAVSEPQEAGVDADLRSSLSNEAVQEWLVSLPLGSENRLAVQAVMADIRDFDVLGPLSKEFVTNVAEVGGIAFGTVFSSFGILSIFAGVLLIFLIFVMMAAERRSELGIARAVGMRRSHLMQMFVTEGLVYDLAAALVGLGLGLLVSYGMIGFLSGLLSNIGQQLGKFVHTFSLPLSGCADFPGHRLLSRRHLHLRRGDNRLVEREPPQHHRCHSQFARRVERKAAGALGARVARANAAAVARRRHVSHLVGPVAGTDGRLHRRDLAANRHRLGGRMVEPKVDAKAGGTAPTSGVHGDRRGPAGHVGRALEHSLGHGPAMVRPESGLYAPLLCAERPTDHHRRDHGCNVQRRQPGRTFRAPCWRDRTTDAGAEDRGGLPAQQPFPHGHGDAPLRNGDHDSDCDERCHSGDAGGDGAERGAHRWL